MLTTDSAYIDLAIDRHPLKISPEKFLIEAVRQMRQMREGNDLSDVGESRLLESRASCVLVMNSEELLGIFSKWDALQLIEQGLDWQNVRLAEVIAPPSLIIERSQIQDLDMMLDLLQRSRCRHLPVFDDHQVLGIITQESILFAKQKLTEDTLNRLQAQRNAVLSAIPDLIYLVSAEGIYLECFASRYVTDLLEESINPIGRHLLEVLPKELGIRKLQAIDRAIVTGEIQSFEQQWNINGKLQYEEVQVVRVTDREALTIIRNISDRKQAEEALRESEMRFRSVFNNPYVAISLADYDGKLIDVNPALCNILGYSPDELKSLSFQEITHPDDLENDLSHYHQLLNNEIDGYHIEKRYIHKNGQTIWGMVSVGLVKDSQDHPLYDIAIVQNINELKLTQQKLHSLNQELEVRIQERTNDLAQSEALKQEILNAIPDLLLRLKVDGTCLDCILPRGADVKAFVPIKKHISELLPAEILDEQINVYKQAIATGEVQVYEHEVMKYGEIVYEEVRVSPCGDDEVLVLVRNISDRKYAEMALQLSNEKLILANQELERATRHKDDFLANMSHELRTPLNAIIGISEGLLDQVFGALTPRQIISLTTIQNSGKHLLELINDILDVSKIESGMFNLDLSLVSVKQLCQNSLSFIKHQADQKQLEIDLHIHNDVPSQITVDERRIRQLLINLLNNAVKFTPNNGKICLEVKLDSSISANHDAKPDIIFAVFDSGIGISEEDIDRLFRPFVQIDTRLNRQYTGTGLGLALVKRLAELHGGQVKVESIIGKGSCFSVRIPQII